MTITKKTAKEIITHLLDESPVFTQRVNNGVTNKVYKATLKSGKYLIVRISTIPGRINQYLKEQWCCNEAKKLGIPVPEILEVGNTVVPFPYMVATETYGIAGNLYDGDCTEMYRSMGEYAKKIHTIKTTGFGDIFDWSSNVLSKNDTWKDFLARELNIDRIMDFYNQHSILTDQNLKKIKRIAKEIKSLEFEPRLCHSDLLPKNVIVNKDGVLISIIDWEGARSGYAVIWDLAVTLNNIEETDQKTFLEGYGMSPRRFQEIEPMVRGFYVIRKHDMVELHVSKKEEKHLLTLQNKFNKLLDNIDY